jgi:hypothetical protein
MRGDIIPLPQYAFMAWSSVKAQGQLNLNLLLYYKCAIMQNFIEIGFAKPPCTIGGVMYRQAEVTGVTYCFANCAL